jgi:hypothetical protein
MQDVEPLATISIYLRSGLWLTPEDAEAQSKPAHDAIELQNDVPVDELVKTICMLLTERLQSQT